MRVKKFARFPNLESPVVQPLARLNGGTIPELKGEQVVNYLEEHYPVFKYPVREGISADVGYRKAMLGNMPMFSGKNNVNEFHKVEGLSLFPFETGVGEIPVIFSESRDDFETLLRISAKRNEPVPIEKTTGAAMVTLVNAVTRREKKLPAGECLDRLFLSADGPYSQLAGIPEKNVSGEDWIRLSRLLRMEHESCHLIARQTFPQLRFDLQDEVIADFGALMGTGYFSLESLELLAGCPDYKWIPGGRWENYRIDSGYERSEYLNLIQKMIGWMGRYFEGFSIERWREEKIKIVQLLTSTEIESFGDSEYLKKLEELLASHEI